MSDMPPISMRFLHRYPNFSLDVDVELPGQGISGLFGPSGSGKTTLLRCVAGLEIADEGELRVKGETWQSSGTFMPTHKRPVGYVFQEASLFPHLTAMGNLRYAMRRAGPDSRLLHWLGYRESEDSQTTRALEQAVDLLGISHLLHRYPHQLSGGERQRVAIARALLIQPRLLLMDEPLASLDTARKEEILPYLERLHRELTIPILYVSHSIDEMTRLADHLVVLNEGKVSTAGPVAEVLANSDFPVPRGDELGVVLEGSVVAVDDQWQLAKIAIRDTCLWIPLSGPDKGQPIRLRILASDVSLALSRHEDSSFLNILEARITDITTSSSAGSGIVSLEIIDGVTLLANLTLQSIHRMGLTVGRTVWTQVKSVAVLR